MTFVGRTLIVVIVLLSVCVAAFTATAYTVQQNWKTAYAALDADYKQSVLDTSNLTSKLENDITVVKKERDQLEIERDNLQGALGRVTGERDLLTEQVGKDQATLAQLQEQNRIALAENERSKEIATTLRVQLGEVQTQLDKTSQANRTLEDTVYTLNKDKENIIKQYTVVLEENGELKQMNQKTRLALGNFEYEQLRNGDTPPPVVEAKVTATSVTDRGKTVLVEISIGKDDGVKIGHRIDVFREGVKPKYLGTIVLTNVTADKAVGILDLDTKNGIIEKGDHVTTQL